jgi:hypothetical protein
MTSRRARRTAEDAILTIPRAQSGGAMLREAAEFPGDDHVRAGLNAGPAGYRAAVAGRGNLPEGVMPRPRDSGG